MTSLDPSSADDEELVKALVAYDDALAAGVLPQESQSSTARVPSSEFESLKSMLNLMESVWPRSEACRSDTATERKGDDHVESASEAETALRNERPLCGQIGRFQIVRELGSGGFGVVYLANDPKLKRRVALKLPRPEILGTPNLRKKVLREAQATSALDHPHILSVFETGEIGSICYLVSPYCAGGTLNEYLANREQPLSSEHAAELVLLLAQATHYAHLRGVLHRDLKPRNVLVELLDTSQPRAGGSLEFRPRIMDFGLAKMVDTDFAADLGSEGNSLPAFATQTGTIIGTPSYMAPEQVESRREAIGPATDVYGLGTILYETLTGIAPFTAPGKLELLRQVLAKDPEPPRHIRRNTPKDLEAICLKCLEKRPEHRYQSAMDLATDLRRFLRGEPTYARPLTVGQRTFRWTRQHPVMAAWIAALAVTVSLILAGLTIHSARVESYAGALQKSLDREAEQKREADRHRRLAEQRELDTRRLAYASDIKRAWEMRQTGQQFGICKLLNRHRPQVGQADVRGFEWHYLWSLQPNPEQVRGQAKSMNKLQFSPNGRYCAFWNSHFKVVDDTQGAEAPTLIAENETIYVWHVPTRSLRWRLRGDNATHAVGFSQDEKQVTAVCGAGTIHAWDLETGKTLGVTHGPMLQIGNTPPASIVAFSPNSRQFAYTSIQQAENGSQTTRLNVWDVESRQSHKVSNLEAPVSEAARYARDGVLLAVASRTSDEDWNVVEVFKHGALFKRSPNLTFGPVWQMAFSPDSQKLVLSSRHGALAIWDMETEALAYYPVDHEWVDAWADVSLDGTIACGRYDRQGFIEREFISLWQGEPRGIQAAIPTGKFRVDCVQFSPDGKTLAYGGERGTLGFWSMHSQGFVSLPAHEKETWSVSFAPNARLVATGSDDHTARIWDALTRQHLQTLRGHRSLIAATAFSPDGRTLATSSFDCEIKLWDVATGRLLRTLSSHEGSVRSLAFHPSERLLISASDDQTIKIWDTDAGRLLLSHDHHGNKVRAVVIDPSGDHFVTADNDGFIKLWDARQIRLLRALRDATEVQSLALTFDGKLLAAGSKEGVIRLYTLPEMHLVTTLESSEGAARALAFGTDGRTLASGGEDAAITLWHVTTGQELFSLSGVHSQVNSLAFSADGRTLAAATHDGKLTLWQSSLGNPNSP